MYRSDKQFMTNPATAAQRIYIGALPKTVVAGDLEDKFGAHGKIIGLSMQSGFAFIQFETAQQAQAAIQAEHGSILYGKKIIVRQALDKSKGQPQQKFAPNRNFQQQNQQERGGPGRGLLGDSPAKKQASSRSQEDEKMQTEEHSEKDESEVNKSEEFNKEDEEEKDESASRTESSNKLRFEPPRHRDDDKPLRFEEPPSKYDDPPSRYDDRFDEPPSKYDEPPSRYDDPPSRYDDPPSRYDEPSSRYDEPPPPRFDDPPPRFEDRDRDRPRYDDLSIRESRFDRGGRRRGRGGRDMRGDRFQPPPHHDKFRDQSFFGREEPFPPPQPYNPPPPVDRPERNDCEIIVVSKALTEYAEYIEQRLKSLGLIVDLLFPNEDVPIGRVLANISSRGCLYAILVMPQNEEHRSLTLNVLHGLPQEHRNMPVEDALILITRNFEAYMRGDPVGPETTSGLAMTLSDRHPISVQMLLNLLAENRQLTSGQYDKLLAYLQERRALQVQYELAEGIETGEEGSSKQAELQNRILNILNKSNDSPAAQAPPVTTPIASTGVTPTPLLKDPTVQKALDSLMLGDMLKAMGTAS